MGDIKNYIKQRFATFKEPPLCDFTMFDANLWPDNLVGFGQKEMSNLVNQKHNYISEEEKEKAINKRSLLRRSVKLQVKQRKNLFEIYTDFLREGREDTKNILVILNIMLVISANTASADRGFSKLNIDKTSLCTRFNSNTLNNIMRVGIENIPMKKFDSRPILNVDQRQVSDTLEDTKYKVRKV